MVERRQSPRVDAGVPVELDVGDQKALLGIAHEVSETGLSLFTQVELTPDTTITLRFRPKGPKGDIEQVAARVVRSGPNDEESLWPVRSAVTFAESIEVSLEAFEED